MKKIKNNSLDIKIIIGSLVMVVGLFVMAFFFFPNNNQNVNTNNEIAKASTGFTATRNLTGGSSIEYLSSNTIHIVSGNVTYSNSITGSGKTTVIYLEPNATLTVRSQSNGWAGIEITSGTLIIVGGAGSKVYAYGVDADNGQDGGAGGSGYLSGKYYYTGAGGKGGKGGHGASAGIGGYGGAGGSGGAGGGKIYYNGSDWVGYTKESVFFGNDGKNGANGKVGSGMGTVYILGSVSVTAQGGKAGVSDGNGGSAGQANTVFFTLSGGGGGGGGGCGWEASNIGDGGNGGGGGGGGGSGAVYLSPTSIGGSGGSGANNASNGTSSSCGSSLTAYRGLGGAGGEWGGTERNNGTLYTQGGKTVSGRTGINSNGKISQLQYTATFDRQGGSNGTTSSTVYLGQNMDKITPPTRAGYTFQGYYSSTGGAGTKYYDNNGYSTRDWNLVGDKTLYAYWIANQYSVKLNKYGGSGGTVGPITATYDSPMPTISVPTQYGYEFQGYYWYSNGGGTKYYNANGTSEHNWDKTNDTSIEAYWKPISRTLHFNANGGSGSMTAMPITFGTATRITKNAFTRLGYTFKRWKHPVYSKDGVYEGDEYFNDEENFTLNREAHQNLYAEWTPIDYKITYNLNGGNGDREKTYNILSTETLPQPSRLGYEFAGWKVTSLSLSEYDSTEEKRSENSGLKENNWIVGNTYSTGSSLSGKYGSPTLTAEWRAKDWTLIYNANGGEVTPTSKIVTIDTEYETLPVPTKKGSIFVGWYTALSGGNVVNETTKMTTEGATIYAHWQETWANKTTVTVLRTENNVLKPGVENNPYLISDAEELAYLAKAVENGDNFDNIYFKQTANIDLKKDKNNNTVEYVWLPIGSKASPFSGHYDGQGFVISNIQTSNISNASTGKLRDYQGLFGYTTNAFLQKINLINGAIYGSGDLGGIVGHMSGGKISNCLNGATVTGNANCGLIGYADCVQITSCYNYGAIKGTENVGGIVGYAHSIDETLKTIIRNCYSRCDIVATTSAGGIAGGARANTKISACGFKGNVTASTNKATLVGISATNVEISNSFAIITGTSDMNFNNGSGTATNCISKLSDESHKKYIGTSFENWSVLLDNSGNGQPLPAGFSWLGIGGKKLTESDIINLGYVKS